MTSATTNTENLMNVPVPPSNNLPIPHNQDTHKEILEGSNAKNNDAIKNATIGKTDIMRNDETTAPPAT